MRTEYILSIVLCLLVNQITLSQKSATKIITAGFSQNINLWLPGNFLNDDSDLNAKKKSSIMSAYIQVTALHSEKLNFKVGPAFKRIGYMVDDRINEYIYTTQKPGDPPVTVHEYLPTDYKARSLNLGLIFSLERKLPTKRAMFVGLNAETYLVEFYKAGFVDDQLGKTQFMPAKAYPFYDRFALSNATASISYTYCFAYGKNLSAALKTNVGMNIHSAWDQFSKYAFLGLGLEIGFWNIKAKE